MFLWSPRWPCSQRVDTHGLVRVHSQTAKSTLRAFSQPCRGAEKDRALSWPCVPFPLLHEFTSPTWQADSFREPLSDVWVWNLRASLPQPLMWLKDRSPRLPTLPVIQLSCHGWLSNRLLLPIIWVLMPEGVYDITEQLATGWTWWSLCVNGVSPLESALNCLQANQRSARWIQHWFLWMTAQPLTNHHFKPPLLSFPLGPLSPLTTTQSQLSKV